jgi:CubicO group peptidase (beta-lactamase class C family)
VTLNPLPAAAPEEIGLSAARLDRLGAVMAGEIGAGRVPGAVALIARRGRLGYFESFGRRDAASAAPMAKDSIFRIYSMTKPITSVAAMMLWEEGRFLLGDPIAQYLPELASLKVAVQNGAQLEYLPPDRPVSIQDLLRHTSGLTYEFRGAGPVHKMYMAAKVSKAAPIRLRLSAGCRCCTSPERGGSTAGPRTSSGGWSRYCRGCRWASSSSAIS